MRFQRSAAVLVAVLGLVCPAQSETTRRWEQGSFDDFRKGKAENISVRSDGKLMLSPRLTDLFEPPAAFLWTLAEDSKGNIFAGGGPGARLFRIGADGRKSTFFERDNVEVHAVAIDAEDNVFAATSPSGKIYKIDPSGGYEVFFDPGAQYIWDMVFDAGGNLFVATGDEGKVFRVTPDGKGEAYFETGETHVRAMLIDNDGNLIVGTDPSALILRVSPSANGPSGFVAYQASKKEITALALGGDGSIYAAAAGNRPGATPRRTTRTTTVTVTRPAATASQSGATGPQASGTPPTPVQSPPPSTLLTRLTGGSEIYRILPDGEPREVWSSETETAYALGLDKEDRVLVGTGERGRLFRVESETLETLVATMPSDQVTALLRRPSGAVVVATSNVGKIYELGPGLAENGTFESDVLDAEGFARWGRLEWDNQLPDGTAISISTRSGNLESPSNNWSGWGNSIDSGEGGQAGSPAARFLQWRARLSRNGDASPLLDAVHVYYLPKNVRPLITHLEATPPNYRFADSKPRGTAARSLMLPPLGEPAVRRVRSGSPASGSPMLEASGRVGVRWVADDENDDDLVFKVEIRGEGEQNWKLLEEDVEEPQYDWDGTSFADGLYRVRITASDAPSNPASEVLTYSKVSEAFAIDNSAPMIRDLKAERDGETIRVRFAAVDSASLLRRAEYSLDGADWEQVLPTTRLLDSRELSFDFATTPVEGSEHTVAVRVYDRFENLAAAKVVVR